MSIFPRWSELADKGGVKREERDYFNILGLPTELISHVFSFLSMEDRLRTRVNKKLDGIELSSKYHVEYLIIEEVEEVPIEIIEWMMLMKDAIDDEYEEENEHQFKITQRITLYKDKVYSPDCIKRIAQNVSIGILEIKLTGSNEFHRAIYNSLRVFEIDYLCLEADSFQNEILSEMMVDSFFLDLSRVCKSLYLFNCYKITPEALHQVYKNVIDGSVKHCYLLMCNFNSDKCDTFLNLIGITYTEGRFFSNRDRFNDSAFRSNLLSFSCVRV